ncbi:AMP-binding protein [Streptomyces sp. NPDC096132]|uniref:AMP-binding protein n=1 Tax=Streptomyces sp. NPDC096132 TaxID=3366075 RepID=UPI0037F138A6
MTWEHPALASVPHAVEHWAERRPEAIACRFIRPDLTVERELRYADLRQAVLEIAAGLASVAGPGDRVVLLLPPGPDYLVSLLGCLRIGVVAVPLYPPRPGARTDRIDSVVRDCGATHVLTVPELMDRLADPSGAAPPTAALHTVDSLRAAAHDRPRTLPAPPADGFAFLQYTSGSTGRPKGVMVGHRNLVENQRAIAAGFALRPTDIVVSWLPMYHDMGLIGTALVPLYLGLEAVFLDTFSFLHDPLAWPRAIAAYRGTCSGGPDFGYRLLADRYDPEALDGTDLSAWRVAFNGAEPIDHRTLDRFAGLYGRHGFSPRAFLPCYGLAEATLFVTGRPSSAAPATVAFDRRVIEQGLLVPSGDPATGSSVITLVSCGRPEPGTNLVVRDDKGLPATDGTVGEICLSGPSVTLGYWGAPDATAEVFHTEIPGRPGAFLRTGDLGALVDGELYVVGRAKDVIIVAGRNHHAHDIEAAAWAAGDDLRAGGAAAFQLDDELRTVVVVLEVGRQAVARLRKGGDTAAVLVEALATAVRRAVAAECGLDVADVVLVPPGAVARTSSGKIRRSETRRLLLDGMLRTFGRSSADSAGSASGRPSDAPPSGTGTVREVLRAQVSRRLGHLPDETDCRLPLAALGYDSLALVALKGAVERELGRPVEASLFFGHLSLDEITTAVSEPLAPASTGPAETGETAGPVTTAAPIEAGNASGPLSQGQIQLQFYDRLHTEDVANNLPFAVRFARRIAPEQIRHAVADVVSAYPSLRAAFGPMGTGSAVISAGARFDWLVQEFSDDDPKQVRDYLEKSAFQRFDLTEGPLVRAIVALTPHTTTLLLVCHHAVVDYWSLRIVAARIMTELLGPGCLPSPASEGATAADWARVEARTAADPRAEAKLRELAEKWHPLSDHVLFPGPLPTVRRRNPAGLTDFELGPELTAALYGHARARGITPFTSIAAAYLRALHLTTGHPRVVIGTPHHGRTEARFAGTVGYLVNLIPVLGDFTDGDGPKGLEERTWRELRTSMAAADVPFARLVRALGPGRHGQNPLFQSTLTFQQSADDLLPDGFSVPWSGCRQTIGGVEVSAIDIPPRDVGFALSLYGARDGDRLVFRLVRQRALVAPDTARQICDAFQDSLLTWIS